MLVNLGELALPLSGIILSICIFIVAYLLIHMVAGSSNGIICTDDCYENKRKK